MVTESGLPGVGIAVPGTFLNDSAFAATVNMPGQVNEGFSGLGPSDLASSGPHPDHTLTGHAHPDAGQG